VTEEMPTPELNRPPMPRWLKALIAAGVLIIFIGAITVLLGVSHGPGMHGIP
jgi:hypothetical protein